MALVIYIPCDGHDHRLALERDGTLTALDHDQDQLNAFMAFGAKAPPCLRVFQQYQPLEAYDFLPFLRIVLKSLVDRSTRATNRLLQLDFARLAHDFADRAADAVLWVEDDEGDPMDIPADLIATIGDYITGQADKDTLADERLRAIYTVDDFNYSGENHGWSPAVYRCAIFAAEAALYEDAERSMHALLQTAERSAELVVALKEEAGIEGDDDEMDEALWQLDRVIERLVSYGGKQ
jgi:hypothetical protein